MSYIKHFIFFSILLYSCNNQEHTLWKKAHDFYENENYIKTVELYTKVIELNPDNFMAYNSRGLSEYNLDNFQNAIIDYSHAIEINDNFVEAYYNWGLAYYSIDKFDLATQDFSKVIDIKSDDYMAYYQRGYIKMIIHNYNDAISDFKKRLNTDKLIIFMKIELFVIVFLKNTLKPKKI